MLLLHHPGHGAILRLLAQFTTTRLCVARLNVPRHSPAGRGLLPLCRACARDRESPAHSKSSRAAVWTRPWRSAEPRSEERRVGKEGRSRSAACHSKKETSVAPQDATDRLIIVAQIGLIGGMTGVVQLV